MTKYQKHILELTTDPDFIISKRFENSLTKLLESRPDGCSDRFIAGCLGITEEQVIEMYQNIVFKLRDRMGV